MANKLITIATFEHINQASMMKEWLDPGGYRMLPARSWYQFGSGIANGGANRVTGF